LVIDGHSDGAIDINLFGRATSMRILQYHPYAFTANTAPTLAIWGWARALADLGLPVVLLHHGGETNGDRSPPTLTMINLSSRGKARWLRPVGLGGVLRKDDVVILHSGYVYRNWVAAKDVRKARVPYVVAPHGAYAQLIRSRRTAIRRVWEVGEQRMLEHALAVHVLFEEERADVERVAPGAKFITAPNGVDVPAERWQGGGGYLAWLGRYDVVVKGLDLLADAVALIDPSRRPQIVLHGIDDRQTRAEVAAQVARRQLQDWIAVRGPIFGHAKLRFLVDADGYIQPSRADAQSAALEAMALGVPTMVSASVAASSSLATAGAAVVVDATPVELSRGLEKLMGSGAAVGTRGRSFVEQRLAWPRVASDFLAQLEGHLASD
jgi:glycosyltransferase involved in cell wall biosynthesis